MDIISPDAPPTPTGLLFERQEVASVLDALARFDKTRDHMTAEACRANALRFSRSRFRAEISDLVEDALAESGMYSAARA